MTRRTTILIGFLFQVVAVFAIFLPNVLLHAMGATVTLKTLPVDPRSIFRGDYVILAYEVGQGAPNDWEYGRPVYVVIRQNGEAAERLRFSDTRPQLMPGEFCLRGVSNFNTVNFSDIAQYFVEEGEGRELEQARNARRLFVDVVVSPSCRAAIKGVRLGPEVPASELPQDPFFPRAMPPEPIESTTPAVQSGQ